MNVNMGGEKTADGYVSKTGFSSLNIAAPRPPVVPDKKPAAVVPNDQVPYEKVESHRRSSSKSNANNHASLFASFANNAPGAASTQIKGFTNDWSLSLC